jgi:hypothetical protein
VGSAFTTGYTNWNVYFSLISRDFTHIKMIPESVTNRNEVSQSIDARSAYDLLERSYTAKQRFLGCHGD